MNGYRVSELADRTGFRPSTLRYYDRIGLLPTERTPAGYRTYGEPAVARLAFIARAKRFGIRLDDIRELVAVRDDGLCAPVKTRLRTLLAGRSADVADRIDELTAFAADLREAHAALDGPTPAGPCDDTCGCTPTHAPPVGLDPPLLAVPAAPPPQLAGDPPVACTLSGADQAGRAEAWAGLAAQATDRRAVDGGLRLTFPADPELVGRLADLAVREQRCCAFFRFILDVAAGGVRLDVRAPDDATDLLTALFGAPSQAVGRGRPVVSGQSRRAARNRKRG